MSFNDYSATFRNSVANKAVVFAIKKKCRLALDKNVGFDKIAIKIMSILERGKK